MEPIFGVHDRAMVLRASRMEILARNLANADTPNFKARDMDFTQALGQAGQSAGRLTTTHQRHQTSGEMRTDESVKYRVPHQPAADGNTVEADMELSRFAENAIAYQTSLMFLNGRIASLRMAIRGGR